MPPLNATTTDCGQGKGQDMSHKIMPPTQQPVWKQTSLSFWLWAAMLLHFAFSLALGLSRHWSYMSSIMDLGVFDQILWNTLHGDFFKNTITFPYVTNYLGCHFNLILLLFAPFYAIIPSPAWFVIAQAASLSLTAWPLFLIAGQVFKCEKTALLWALIYLVNPFQLGAGSWFHPVSLAVPFLAMALLAVVIKNERLLYASCLLVLACQEHFGPTVVGLGALWWLRNRSWRPALTLIAFGSLHLVLVLGVAMPFFSPTSAPLMLSEQQGALNRYNWLGTSLFGVLHTLATQPLWVWDKLLSMGGVFYWILLVAPFWFLFPLLGIEFLLAGLGDLAANTLSAGLQQRNIFSYHSAGLIPALSVAALYGVARLSGWQKKFSALELTSLILIPSLAAGYAVFPAPLPGAANSWEQAAFPLRPEPAVQAINQLVGNDASLSVQANVGAHFSQRQKIFTYPLNVGETDFVILRLASPTTNLFRLASTSNINQASDPLTKNKFLPSPANWLEVHLQLDRTQYLASIECLLSENTYGIALWNDPWLVLSRQTANRQQEMAVKQKVKQLQEGWQISAEEYQESLKKCQGSGYQDTPLLGPITPIRE